MLAEGVGRHHRGIDPLGPAEGLAHLLQQAAPRDPRLVAAKQPPWSASAAAGSSGPLLYLAVVTVAPMASAGSSMRTLLLPRDATKSGRS